MSKTSKMYIKGVLRYINTRDQSNVEDVEDRSNTPKGCNAMYVEDVEETKTSLNCVNFILYITYIALQSLGVFDLSLTSSTIMK